MADLLTYSLHELSGTCRVDKVHKDLTDARIKRDTEDVEKIMNYMVSRDSFDQTPLFRQE